MKPTHVWVSALSSPAGKTVHAHQLDVDGIPIAWSLCASSHIDPAKVTTLGERPERVCRKCTTQAKKLDEREAYTPSEACVKAARILNKVFGGLHHVETIRDFGIGAEVVCYGHLATWDFNKLTELVVAAHDDCVRMEIAPAGNHWLRLMFHPRKGREGSGPVRHPTMEQALEDIRKRHAAYDAGFDAEGTVQYVKGHSQPKRDR